MNAVSMNLSPTSSASPPVTPVPLFHGNSLLPIKSFPTWNRTGLKNNKEISHITKNKNLQTMLVSCLNKAEVMTQTSPPSSSNSSDQMPLHSIHENQDSNTKEIRRTYEKRILFIQANHQRVLLNLQRELEKLKLQNKALQFQLIMAGGTSQNCEPITQVQDVYAQNFVPEQPVDNGIGMLRGEVMELQKSLHDIKNENMKLSKKIKERDDKTTVKRKASTEKHLSSYTGYDRILPAVARPACMQPLVDNTNVVNSAGVSYEGAIKELKNLTNKQKNELLQLKEKLREQHPRPEKLVLPKLEVRNRLSAKSYTLDRNISRAPVSLPVLQPSAGTNNLTLRQKRAQALHIQRQRSNKDVTLMLGQ
ncbi:uncharacterized protein LOC130624071 isoform X2 [Hydractinia symbiolongicarpus]|nr:uncharacterized protein LOC130624071 isoform X2 [Hydractinia symbiolongicarpus]XP_057295625.1 uncharacterized protein LOC130624071 isoform X2 [Hydractinia symbiolongicarpus]